MNLRRDIAEALKSPCRQSLYPLKLIFVQQNYIQTFFL